MTRKPNKQNKQKDEEFTQIVHELNEQIQMMEKMLLTKEDRTAQLHIQLLEERAKKRPVLDANLWLGIKIGTLLGSIATALFMGSLLMLI